MPVKIVVVRIKAESNIGILFHSDCTGEQVPLPAVSLSRTKGKCIFPIDRLHEHDDHTPWHSDSVKANVYCERVVNDIKEALDAKGIKYEIVYTEAQLKKPTPEEAMHAAFEKGQVEWKPGGKVDKVAEDDKLGKLISEKLVVTKDARMLLLGSIYVPN